MSTAAEPTPGGTRAGAPLGAIDAIGRGVATAPSLRAGFGTTMALAVVGAGGRVAVPILLQQAIDRGMRRSDVDLGLVTRMAVTVAVAVVLAGLAQRWAMARLGIAAESALYDIRTKLFHHIHRLSMEDHSAERRGALVARVTSDVETLTQFFAWGGVAWMLNITVMTMVAAVMIAYDWLLAIVVLTAAAPLAVLLRAVQRRLVTAYDAARERNSAYLSSVSELVTGAETLHAYGAADAATAAASHAARGKYDANIRANVIGAFLFPSGELFSVLAVTAVTAVGVWLGPDRGLSAGALVGFVFLTYRFLEPVAELTEVLDLTQTAVAGLRKILGVLEIPAGPPEPEQPRALPDGPLGMALDGVTFHYRPRSPDEEIRPALVDVSCHIPAGQKVAVVGATGSGKTTMARMLARLADPVLGTVRLGGVDLRHVASEELRRRLVFVPQEPFLFDTTVEANLAFASPGITRHAITAAFRELDLADWLAGLSDGLSTRVGERGDALSAGERQLLALVRAALADPAVLILDEATSSVDPLTEVRLSRALDRLSTGRTVVAIAHRLSTAAGADRVLVFHDGRLVQDGAHAELVERDGVYQELYAEWLSAVASEARPG
jgi:putative ABC transport system ATP-binding protein